MKNDQIKAKVNVEPFGDSHLPEALEKACIPCPHMWEQWGKRKKVR